MKSCEFLFLIPTTKTPGAGSRLQVSSHDPEFNPPKWVALMFYPIYKLTYQRQYTYENISKYTHFKIARFGRFRRIDTGWYEKAKARPFTTGFTTFS